MKPHMFKNILVTGKEAARISSHMTYRDSVVLEQVVNDAMYEFGKSIKKIDGPCHMMGRWYATMALEAVFVAGFLQGMRQLRRTQRIKCRSNTRKRRDMELCR